jgi:glucose-6-phosphate 1-dehydrogenase
LRKRAQDSLNEHVCGIDDKDVFEKLSQSMSYVDGDYRDAKTYTAIHDRLGAIGAARR